MSEADLSHLLSKARKRNRSEGITGLLIYDSGCFFQWLEGPHSALMRIWEVIKHDPAHRDIEILRRHVMPKRLFGAWDMRLARRPGAGAMSGQRLSLSLVSSTQDWVERLRSWPQSLSKTLWDEVFTCTVLPQLDADSAIDLTEDSPAPSSLGSAIWHPAHGAAAELARWLLTPNSAIAEEFVAGMITQGAGLESVYSEVFEPAARHIGALWGDDRCTDIQMSFALSRLQCMARTLGSQFATDARVSRSGHSVLVTPQPGETHMLGTAMNCELFWRAGWNVSCEFPPTDRALDQLLRKQWFDVLDLSMSSAVGRDHRLQALETTISGAHAASMNPALTVIVDGRAFFEKPARYIDVGADAGCISAADSIRTACRLMDAALKETPLKLVPSVGPSVGQERPAERVE